MKAKSQERSILAPFIAVMLAVSALFITDVQAANAALVAYKLSEGSPNAWYTTAAVTLNGGRSLAQGFYVENRIQTLRGSTVVQDGVGSNGTTAAVGGAGGMVVTAAQGGRSSCGFRLQVSGNNAPIYMECRYSTP